MCSSGTPVRVVMSCVEEADEMKGTAVLQLPLAGRWCKNKLLYTVNEEIIQKYSLKNMT